jgi:hypothetical protein
MELLRRLVLAVGSAYENLDSAAALLEKTGHNKEAVEFLDQLVKATPWDFSFRLRLAKARIAAAQDAASAQENLAKIAAGPQAPYNLRVEAALALAGARGQYDFGSGELKLLAGDSRGISASAANQPYFYDAPLRAAQGASDAHVKLQLLGAALGDGAARDDARLPLFHAAASLRLDEFALASIEHLLREQSFLRVAPSEGNEEEEIVSSVEPEANIEEASPVFTPAKISPAQQLQLARSVGEVMIRLERLNEALPYLQLAAKLEKTPARRKEINAEITNAKGRLRRQQQNAARQPILHAELEQDRLVRPRLVPRGMAPAQTNAKSGERP